MYNYEPHACLVHVEATSGTDGSYIQVKRIVSDRDGNVLREAVFTSNYLPINQIVIYGPGTDLAELKAQYEAEEQ